MRFALLGPVQVGADEDRRELSGAMTRTLLAMLLLDADTVVSVDRLSEALWGAEPPDSATASLHNHVMRLRRLLGDEGGGRIRAVAPGFLIHLEPGELDLDEFASRSAAGRRAAADGRWPDASREAAAALALWRGQPLMDVPGLEGHPRIAQLQEARIQALEEWIEAELQLGRHDGVIGELRALTAEHPLREGLHTQLMLALYRSGRQAEALEAFQQLRRALVEEAGVEPSASAQQLQRRILNADPGLAAPASADADAVADIAAAERGAKREKPRGGPLRQLPAGSRVFTGRVRELEELLALARPDSPVGAAPVPGAAAAGVGTVVISAIDGMAGVGKTALAVHAAHRLAEHYPDGQLFLDLHGYTADLPPRDPADALATILQAQGVSPGEIPPDLEARAALYRDRLAGTRTLILLDNAATEAQVRPLLPGTAGCLVLITSRKRLKALDDAHSLPLDVLPVAEAVALLREVAGPGRVDPDDPLLEEIAQLCGYLPLALRIAAALIRHRRTWTLAMLADRLREQEPGLDQFFDVERDLTGVFDLSLGSLGPDQRRMYRRLGLAPGPDVDAYAAAALADTGLAEAEQLLEDLVDHNLLAEYIPGRYQFHDLVRAYARSRSEQDESVAEREAALDRLLDYYQHTAQHAHSHLARRVTVYVPPVAVPPRHVPGLDTREQADEWMTAELPNLFAAAKLSAARPGPTHAVAMSSALYEHLYTHGPWAQAMALHVKAIEVASELGDLHGQAASLANLSSMQRLTGDFPGATVTAQQALDAYRVIGDQQGQANAFSVLSAAKLNSGDFAGATEAAEQALDKYRATGDGRGEANSLGTLGVVCWATGAYAEAGAYLEQARGRFRDLGDQQGQAGSLINLGLVRQVLGEYLEASRDLQQALDLFRELGDQNGQAHAVVNLGVVLQEMGDHAGAIDAGRQGLELYRGLGDRSSQATALTNLGIALLSAGDFAGSAQALEQALVGARESGARYGETAALNGRARVFTATGDVARARAQHLEALDLARELEVPEFEAEALEGLGEAALKAGDRAEGADYLGQALEIYRRLGIPGAQRVEARLAELG